MRKRKAKLVELIVPRYGLKAAFDIQHAGRILGMGHYNGGWELPPDSKYTYSREYGIRLKSDKADNIKTD